MNRPFEKRPLLGSLGIALVALFCTSMKDGSYVTSWNNRYPGSASRANASAAGTACVLCHASVGGGEPWNAYGWELRQSITSGSSIDQALAAVEPGNLEGDDCGETNLQEITAGTQPGWKPGATNTVYFESGFTQTRTAPGGIAGFLDPCFPTTLVNGSGTNPVILADTGGTPTLSPSINDPSEPFAASLDCSGAGASSLYLVQIQTTELASPLASAFGELICGGPILQRFLGPHARNTVGVGPVVLPNDPGLFGLSYCVQGFCGDPSARGFLSNALTQTIGF